MSAIDDLAALPSASNDVVAEDTAAQAFAESYEGKLLFDHDRGSWFEWTGSHWRQEGTGLAFHWARELARELAADESAKARLVMGKTAFASGVERFSRADRAFAIRSDEWDRDQFLFGTPGGTLDLRTGQLRAADPAEKISKIASVAPSYAECPLWQRFLREAMNGDDELVGFLQRFAGYCLTGDTREHSLLFGHGGGGNGKSVFVNTLAGIMGDYAAVAPMDTFTAAHGDRHPTELAMLRGARLVTASETEEGRAWAESRIKQITAGDPVSARFMH